MRPRSIGVLLASLLLFPGASAAFSHIEDTRPASAFSADDDLRVYPTWPVLTAELKAMAAAHPDVMRLHSAGTSTAGLDLWLVEVADFANAARRPLEHREVLWIDGGTHANEYSGVIFVMHLLRFLVEKHTENETAAWIVENRHTWIMPLLNPEGSMNGIGRVNNNLVNINRNYPVGWGALNEFPVLNNPGPYPASEPETRVALAWWDALRPDYVASIHCCGNLWLYPYGIQDRDPHKDDYPVFERICDEAYFDVRERCGPIWSTIYPASGSSVDAAYEMFGSAAFGFEMSGREAMILWGQPWTMNPVPVTELESWRGVLHAFLNVERYGAHPVLTVAGAGEDRITFTITNVGFGNLTRGTLRVTDGAGVVHEIALPRLAADESAPVGVAGSFGEGRFAIDLVWQKRPFAGEGARDLTLALTSSAAGFEATLDDEPVDVANARAASATTPGPGEALLILAFAALALLVSRRPQ